MIRIYQPSMAINAVNVPGPRYKMWNTYDVPADHTPENIIGNVVAVAKGAPLGRGLTALVINCHGKSGTIQCTASGLPEKGGGFGLSLGTGIRREHTGLFSKLKGLVGHIYIVACRAAAISIPGTTSDGDGNLFCCEIAKNSGAHVYASTTWQDAGLYPWLPYGYIDGFEGQVYRYRPSDGKAEPVDYLNW